MLRSIRIDVNRGFSLVELMIVVAIVAILSTVAIGGFSAYAKKARTPEAILNGAKVMTNLKVYKDTYGFFPASLEAANGGEASVDDGGRFLYGFFPQGGSDPLCSNPADTASCYTNIGTANIDRLRGVNVNHIPNMACPRSPVSPTLCSYIDSSYDPRTEVGTLPNFSAGVPNKTAALSIIGDIDNDPFIHKMLMYENGVVGVACNDLGNLSENTAFNAGGFGPNGCLK